MGNSDKAPSFRRRNGCGIPGGLSGRSGNRLHAVERAARRSLSNAPRDDPVEEVPGRKEDPRGAKVETAPFGSTY